jgi:protein gp37
MGLQLQGDQAMSETTGIEWCDSTFNGWIGCTKVGPGCDHCYAEQRMDTRLHKVNWGAGQPRERTSPANWREPIKWNKRPFFECVSCGWRSDEHGKDWIDDKTCPHCEQPDLQPARRRVFCSSLADVFDNEVDPLWRQHLMSLIADTQNLDWLLLTKRIGNAARMLSDSSLHDGRLLTASDQYRPPKNLWIGATIVNQEEADRDIPKLLATPAAVRFLSMEPLLGAVDVSRWLCPWSHTENRYGERVDWVIVGGESGHKARPMHPDWVRSLRDQCAAAGVPFLFKQWGEWQPDFYPVSHMHMTEKSMFVNLDGSTNYGIGNAGCAVVNKVGKKEAGRTLDCRTYSEYPESAL